MTCAPSGVTESASCVFAPRVSVTVPKLTELSIEPPAVSKMVPPCIITGAVPEMRVGLLLLRGLRPELSTDKVP